MSQIISYWDDTQKKYIEVSTTDPLPTNAIGGGAGGAEEVVVTQPLPTGTNIIGKVEIEEGGKTANVFTANVDTYATADNMLMTGSHMLALKDSGTEWVRLRADSSFNLRVAVNAVPVVGTHANAWNAAAVLAAGTSTSVDCQYASSISIFGNASAATTITVQYSQDNTNFYDDTIDTISANGNFAFNLTAGARYVRLKSSAAATITATIAGKG